VFGTSDETIRLRDAQIDHPLQGHAASVLLDETQVVSGLKDRILANE
jgi:hypothetical protein